MSGGATDPVVERASQAIAAYLDERQRVTVEELREHLERDHRLRASDAYLRQALICHGWYSAARMRYRFGFVRVWTRRPPAVVDLAAEPGQ